MFLEPLLAALRFVQWEDTLVFHARLFRCFLFGLLDAQRELAIPSQGPKWMLVVLGQRFAVGFMHDVGHSHEAISHTASPLARYNDTAIRCPPRRGYKTPSLPPFVANSLTDPTTPVPPPFTFPHSINITHGLCSGPVPPAVAFDPPGSGRVSEGHPPGLMILTVLWLLALAMIILRRPARNVCRPREGAVGSTTSLGERFIRPSPEVHFLMDEAVSPGTPEYARQQATMPGTWFYDCQEQSALETLGESVFDTMPWTLFYSRIQTRMKVWDHFPDLASIFAALDPCNCGPNDVVDDEPKFEDGFSAMCQGPDTSVSMLPALDGSEQQRAAQDHSPSTFGFSAGNLGESTTTLLDRRGEPLAIDDVATKDPAQTTTPNVGCGDEVGFTFSLEASSNADRPLYQEDSSSDVDESASEDGSHGIEDEELFDASVSSLERGDDYRGVGAHQDGALTDTYCPPSIRRARGSGYLWRKPDIFDDDSYWVEQVNVRLSGERDFRRASCRYGWPDTSSWPGEVEIDNWRARNSQVTQLAAPGKTSDTLVRCRVGGNSAKLRRYSSPPLNADISLSHCAGSGDGPHGIYVVPQKRGRMTGTRCWSPVSSPSPFDSPAGLGFFPFRKTPSLLTPEAWRPGCLYIPDPPEEESQANTWWDALNSAGGCESASGAGLGYGTGTVTQDTTEQGAPFPRDASDAPVSWRDRHENDPASRRFISVHRRATTEG